MRRAFRRIDDLDQRALRLTAQHARLTQQLEALPETTRGGRDPHELEHARRDAALRECARALEIVVNERVALVRELGDAASPNVERDPLARAISRLGRTAGERTTGRDEPAPARIDQLEHVQLGLDIMP